MELLRERKVLEFDRMSRLSKVVSLCRLEPLLDRHPYDLSGGEQQRAALAKVLLLNPDILLLDEPTKGVDVGSKAAIYEIMGELAKKGYAIIMISSEMPEILGMCDRVAVMCDGRVTGELNREELDQEQILVLAMTRMKNAEKGGGGLA